MASTSQVAQDAGRTLGLTLRPERKTAFGLLDGFPIQLLPGKEGNQECVLEVRGLLGKNSHVSRTKALSFLRDHDA